MLSAWVSTCLLSLKTWSVHLDLTARLSSVSVGQTTTWTRYSSAYQPAMSTHAHEYGFPSSHSTNTLTIALFLGQWVWEVRSAIGPIATSIASLSTSMYSSTENTIALINLVLMVYMVSVVGGRVYTGMHSIGKLPIQKV